MRSPWRNASTAAVIADVPRVWVGPGDTALTRTPARPYSADQLRVRASTAASSLVLNDAAAQPAARELADTGQAVGPAVRNQRTPSTTVGLTFANVPSLDRILPIITIAWLAGVIVVWLVLTPIFVTLGIIRAITG